MSKVIKLIIFTLNIPLYLISLLIPKNNKLWVFGGWFGEKYSDNTKYLFEYINKNEPRIKAIWLTKNSNVIQLIRKKGFKAFHAYSIHGYLYSAFAGVGIVNQGIIDINRFIPPSIIVNLWHGIPLKKIMYDDIINGKADKYKSIKKLIFPFMRYPEDTKMMIACSEEDQYRFSTAFKIPREDVKITGYPRNDALFSRCRNDKIYQIIYMPTHRKEGKDNILPMLLDYINEMSNNIRDSSFRIDVKLHFYHLNEIKSAKQDITQFPYVNIIDDDTIRGDIYCILNRYDILITDYSSIYFDFLLTDKPIIFFPFDYEEYISRDRELYYKYDLVTPGPKCRSWVEVVEWIMKFKDNPMLYAKERKRIKDMFHKYQDGKSSERVYQEIAKLLDL